MPRPLGPGGIAAGHINLPVEIAALVRRIAAEEDRTYQGIVIRAVLQYAADRHRSEATAS